MMNLDAETPTCGQRSMYILAIGKLCGSLHVCLTYGNGEHPILGLPYPYIDRSRRATFTEDFFAKKPTFTNPIQSLIVGTDQVGHY